MFHFSFSQDSCHFLSPFCGSVLLIRFHRFLDKSPCAQGVQGKDCGKSLILQAKKIKGKSVLGIRAQGSAGYLYPQSRVGDLMPLPRLAFCWV